jgi:hypothetical protein
METVRSPLSIRLKLPSRLSSGNVGGGRTRAGRGGVGEEEEDSEEGTEDEQEGEDEEDEEEVDELLPPAEGGRPSNNGSSATAAAPINAAASSSRRPSIRIKLSLTPQPPASSSNDAVNLPAAATLPIRGKGGKFRRPPKGKGGASSGLMSVEGATVESGGEENDSSKAKGKKRASRSSEAEGRAKRRSRRTIESSSEDDDEEDDLSEIGSLEEGGEQEVVLPPPSLAKAPQVRNRRRSITTATAASSSLHPAPSSSATATAAGFSALPFAFSSTAEPQFPPAKGTPVLIAAALKHMPIIEANMLDSPGKVTSISVSSAVLPLDPPPAPQLSSTVPTPAKTVIKPARTLRSSPLKPEPDAASSNPSLTLTPSSSVVLNLDPSQLTPDSSSTGPSTRRRSSPSKPDPPPAVDPPAINPPAPSTIVPATRRRPGRGAEIWPWGAKMPNIVGWKNDFDLDGEIWIAPREEREQLRAARIQGGGQEGEGEGRSRDGDVEMTG